MLFMDKIDISTDLWSKIAGNISREENLEEGDEMDWKKMKVVERIGSESSEAEVYRVDLDGKEYACKVMPITSYKSFDKNQNEMKISEELSGFPCFPKVFQKAYCEKTVYNKKSLFYEDSYKYFYLENLCKHMKKSERLRTKEKYMRENLFGDMSESVNIGCNILISELYFSDLRQITSKFKLSEKAWKDIILSVLEGIKYLNEDLSILHSDLHCGNVLIKIDKKTIPIISDFGKSQECEFSTVEERIMDSQKFIYDLTLHPDVPQNLKKKLEKILQYISTFPKADLVMTRIINFSKKML